MVSSTGLSEELSVNVAVLCMPGRVSKQNPVFEHVAVFIFLSIMQLRPSCGSCRFGHGNGHFPFVLQCGNGFVKEQWFVVQCVVLHGIIHCVGYVVGCVRGGSFATMGPEDLVKTHTALGG